jgi:hypothetical protein
MRFFGVQSRRWLLPCVFVLLLGAALPLRAQQSYDTPEWKKEIANGCLPYHRLVVEDFPINDAGFVPLEMFTSGFRHYTYQCVMVPKKGRFSARVTRWNVRFGFDRNKSWRRSSFKLVDETLPHEQGHLDISVLHSKRFARTGLDQLPVGEGESAPAAANDLKNKLQALVQRVSKETQAEQNTYDAGTSHGTNQSRQREWTAAIQQRLKQAGISF